MLRIVLVEDNPADAHVLQTALCRTGMPVEIVLQEDGLKAIEYLLSIKDPAQLCDLVLLDLNLPKMNGFEVLERIRANEKLKGLPVIVMSGSVAASEIEHCYRSGANSYICKGTHLDEILATAVQFVAYWSLCVKLPSTAGTLDLRVRR